MGAADEDAPAFAFALAALLLDPLDLRFLDVFLELALPFLSLEDFPLSSNDYRCKNEIVRNKIRDNGE